MFVIKTIALEPAMQFPGATHGHYMAMASDYMGRKVVFVAEDGMLKVLIAMFELRGLSEILLKKKLTTDRGWKYCLKTWSVDKKLKERLNTDFLTF